MSFLKHFSKVNSLLFLGEVWPGPCVFPDFTQSRARSWWADLVKVFVSNGVDGIWNDMNEPAVFKVRFKRFFFYHKLSPFLDNIILLSRL